MRRISPVDQLPDEALLAGYCAGERGITEAFVRRFQAKIFGVALAVVGEPRAAEDVAQQAFERAWRHGHAYDPRRGSVTTWLSVITRNLAIDASRVRRAVPVEDRLLLADLEPSSASPEDAALDGEAAGELQAALRRLPTEQARAVVLAGIAGLSASQVAASEGIPIGTAKTRIRAAMGRLRIALADSAEVEHD